MEYGVHCIISIVLSAKAKLQTTTLVKCECTQNLIFWSNRSTKLKLYNFLYKALLYKHNYKIQGDIDKGCGDFTIHIKSYTNIPKNTHRKFIVSVCIKYLEGWG